MFFDSDLPEHAADSKSCTGKKAIVKLKLIGLKFNSKGWKEIL